MAIFTDTTFHLLKLLRENNNKEWFSEYKADYEKNVRQPFAHLLEELSGRLAAVNLPYQGGEKTMFRVNRDVRFSHDKSPYSTHVSGVMTLTGTKSEAHSLLYFHLEPQGGFCVAGLYHPSTQRLEELRTAIVENEKEYSLVISQLTQAGLELDRSEATKNMPRGFTEYAEHLYAEDIKLKNLMIRKELTPADWTSNHLVDVLEQFALNAEPLLEFVETH